MKDNQSPICDIFPIKVLRKMNISQLREVLKIISSIDVEKFGEYIDELIKIYESLELELYKEAISSLFPNEIVSKESLFDVIRNSWSMRNTDEEVEQMRVLINELLNVPMEELKNWHKLIRNNQVSEVNYYTYHGTKGLEFDNVLILMEKRFGRDPNYFIKFFQQYQQRQNLAGEEKKKYERVRNLLYVSCSRAIKNLRILFLDDISPYREVFQEIFGEIRQFDN
ncbi:hypothetical protein GOQ27_04425 [Clostridium sp. D2Q-11]|uniref:UvrD-like helicase C-terminal domain-containing protein n=1 Tax=Anaeromonas frigoriresistens TaxID=2683708 RepID=A0A942UVR0_9FIRM|nr:hypothetical protein [Anaeromonas frigoriresistens]